MIHKAASLVDIFNMFTPKVLTEEEREFYQKTAHVRDGADYEYHDSLFEYIDSSQGNAHL